MKAFYRFWRFLQRENLHRLIVYIGIALILSSVGIAILENLSWLDGLWWSMVTLTTVGYGDISPVTVGGRLLAFIIMLIGVGLFGAFSATLASILVDQKIKEDYGMGSYNFQEHIILCEWDYHAHLIIDELRADPKAAHTPIILIADIERKPTDDEDLYFIQGDVTEETLLRANIKEASTVIVLGDHTLDVAARDGKVILTTLVIENVSP
ncbi:MAG: ion channel, partial [Chloroflexota bacterium]